MTTRNGHLAALLLALPASHAHAQDIEPRTYANAPMGVNFLVAGYLYTEGGLLFDPSLPLTDANLEIQSGLLAYVRALDVGGRSAKLDVLLPYASLAGDALHLGTPVSREVSGPGDPRLRFSINFHGAPALSLREFAGYRQDLIAGASLQMSLPLGQYDPDKLVNIGTNRWFIKPELGVSKAWGRWTLELTTAATFFGDNDDFFGGKRREQDPVYSFQGHLVHAFPSGVWAALSGTYLTGGRTTLDGVRGDDLQETTRFGATLALPVDRHHSIKLHASSGVSIRTGTDFDAYGIAWQYRWGGGL
ncbi:MAG: transporter [Thiobacillaceae bacterium]|jgi:hypothetical protein|nr:transporter [Thiobacillaceae bacterium]